MFRSVAADLVEDFCGKYLDGVDPSQLNVSMWNGQVKMQNVVLKTSAFDDLGLPVTVVHGTIDLLELCIPWASIQSSPITV
eukprot:CAMPEP_0172191672 /NCGR_PEP_ID=MMETSP1050-20130122/23850_1 /TAXON_ID=233186 /ORGANISM="Cryptomonas curvata, Strain CCAP979/52" /LENGTH=80 /DNA_ID=CAMNT_0012866785 /DNA_START=143 /DNA_END=382 /DNA_ORIENTATION=-